MIPEIFQYDFMINAIIASILASIAFGIVGSYVVVKRIIFISGGISHTAYGGIGLGILLGFDPMLGAIAFSLIAAFIISKLRNNSSNNEDVLIGIMWAFGMALGILFTSMTPGYTQNLSSYLFGNILTVPREELYMMLVLDIGIVSVTAIYFKEFQAITFDEEYARVIGLPVDNLYLLLLIIIALTTVVLIKLVGIILVVALLSIPASISQRYITNLRNMMLLSIVVGMVLTITGLFIAYYFNLAAGAATIILSVFAFLLSNLYLKLTNK
ncbi:MAG: metal ABC transporter permease [Melioribacteraceae bacterium]